MNPNMLRALIGLLVLGVPANPGLGSGAQAQELHWATSAGGGGSSSGDDIAVTPRAESYVTGRFSGAAIFGAGERNETELESTGREDIFIAKYARDGTLLWAKRAGGANDDEGDGIAVTPRGESYVTGRFSGTAIFGEGERNEIELKSSGQSDIFVAKYARDGTVLWAKRAGGAGLDMGRGIAVTPRGESHVTGRFYGTAIFGEGERNETEFVAAGQPDIFIAKYARDGILLWAKRATGASDEGQGIAVTPRGESYVTGNFSGTAILGEGEPNETTLEGGRGPVIAKFDRGGVLLWARRVSRAAKLGGNPQTTGIATTPDGESYVTGWYTGDAVFGEGQPNETTIVAVNRDEQVLYIAKYDRDGYLSWVTRERWGYVFPQGIAVTPRGESYLTGWFDVAPIFDEAGPNETRLTNGGEIFIAKYNRDSSFLWAKEGNGDGRGAGIAVTPRGESYVTGGFEREVIFGEGERNETELKAVGVSSDIFVAKFR